MIIRIYGNIKLRVISIKHGVEVITRWVTQRPRTLTIRTAWYTHDLRTAKREKRRAERKFRKSGLVVHKQLFEESCATYNSLLESTKCSYYRQKI